MPRPKPNKAAPAERNPGRYAYDGLLRPIHEKARLGIMTSLAAYPEGLSFTDLKDLCDLTDGNLNRHLDVLREAELISIEKEQSAARRQTWCRLTVRGQQEFAAYLTELERVVADAARAAQITERARSSRKGWTPV